MFSRKLLIYLLCVNYAGCTLQSPREVSVELPDLPKHLKNHACAMSFSLVFPGSGLCSGITGLSPGSSAVIYLSAPVVPVMAVSSFALESEPYPAGGIFPSDFDGSALHLSWENGFAARVMYQVVTEGQVCFENFNTARFTRGILEKSEGNPWIYSEELLLYSLTRKMFNMNYVKKRKTRNLSIPLPPGGDNLKKYWVTSNPLDSRVLELAEGSIVIENIPERSLRIYPLEKSDGRTYMDLILDSEGWFIYLPWTQNGKSGRW